MIVKRFIFFFLLEMLVFVIFIIQVICNSCKDSIPGCESCDNTKCSNCSELLFLDNDKKSYSYGKCINGIDFCIDFTDEKTCSTCTNFSNKGPDMNGKCSKCKLDYCSSCPYNVSICEDCMDGYVLVNKKCIPCPINCSKCAKSDENDEIYCYKCDKPHYQYQFKCYDCFVDHCAKCVRTFDSNTNKYILGCIMCEDDYYLDVSTYLKCIKKEVENCFEFVNSTYCKRCHNGYGLDENGKCQPCLDTNCIECPNNYKNCLKCNESYYRDSHLNCYPHCFDEKCRNCDKLDYKKCNRCKPGYFLNDNGDCIRCLNNCSECSTDNLQCYSCFENYGVINNECIKCKDQNCDDCDDDVSFCNSCKKGYSHEKGKCVKNTVENCYSHLNASYCYNCNNGYGKINGKCLKCKDKNCIKCDNDVSICTKCIKGYGYSLDKGENYGKCLACSVANCTSCDKNTRICKYCKDQKPRYNSCSFNISNEGNNGNNNENEGNNGNNGNEGDNNDNIQNDHKKKKISKGAIIGISVSACVVVILIVSLSIYFIRCKSKKVEQKSS